MVDNSSSDSVLSVWRPASPSPSPTPSRWRARRRTHGFVLANVAILAATWLCLSWGAAHTQAARERAEDVLMQTALRAFESELPHWWHRAVYLGFRPLDRIVPDIGSPLRLTMLRREFERPASGVVLVDGQAPAEYRRWRSWLQEACHVLGLEVPEAAGQTAATPAGRWPQVGQADARGAEAAPWWDPFSALLGKEPPHRLCPELWVDESWPPSRLAPQSDHALAVWSVQGVRPGQARNEKDRGLVVVQATLIRPYSKQEVKALMGYELGKYLWSQMHMAVPHEWLGKLLQVYTGLRTFQRWQDIAQAPAPTPWARFAGRQQGGIFGLGGGGHFGSFGQGGGSGLQNMFRGPAAPAAEWLAMDMVIRRVVPGLLRPFAYGAMITQGRNWHRQLHQPGGLLDRLLGEGSRGTSRWGVQQRGYRQQLPAPIRAGLGLSAELGIVHGVALLGGMRDRASVITADRAAALAAGDAQVAAAAQLRHLGLLPKAVDKSPKQLAILLDSMARNTDKRVEWRKEEPRIEVRVRELLHWSQTEVGQRLLAFAEMRRGLFKQRRFGLAEWMRNWRQTEVDDDEEKERIPWWRPWLRRLAFVLLIVAPIATPIDAVRWASGCTLGLTCCGVAAPFLHGAGIPLVISIVVAGLLLFYASCVFNIWWNHLLGGSRHWARLSSQLTGELAEQADLTAGIAYLTQEWAEMARRSLAALDQELCGSWRTSLQELATKLTDLQQELEREPAERGRRGRLTLDLPATARPLWLRVDSAVQQAARTETARMHRALDTDDPETLQAMMTWWLDESELKIGGDSAPPYSTHASSSRRRIRALPYGAAGGAPDNGHLDDPETLSSLLHSDELHTRYHYPSFHGPEEVPDNSEAFPQGEEFRRLERMLASNSQGLEELRMRLQPWEDPKTALLWTWADLRRVHADFQRVLRMPALGIAQFLTSQAQQAATGVPVGPSTSQGPEDQLTEARIMSCLLLAMVLGGAAAFASLTYRFPWCWTVGCIGFSAANACLLLNYSKLYLPHVHRRFENRLAQLSTRREALLQEIRGMQQETHRAGMTHVKACIFLQSVNVLRNINYIMLCVKTEVQRAALPGSMMRRRGMFAGPHDPRQAALCGLRLLEWLLPHNDARGGRADLSTDEDAALFVELLGFRRRGWQQHDVQRRVADAQKRLWIMFRMVHLSTALPTRVQGQLQALIEMYLRPILVEGRVPLGHQPTLELRDREGQRALQQAAGDDDGRDGGSRLKAIADDDDSGGDGGAPSSAQPHITRFSSSASSLREADDRWEAASSLTVSSNSRGQTDTPKILQRLVAGPTEFVNMMHRLPSAALLDPQASAQLPASTILVDTFSSIVVTVADQAGKKAVGAAIGFNHGDKVYALPGGLRTNIMLRVAFSDGAGVAMEEKSLPLTAVLEEEPSLKVLTALWGGLSSASPGRFGDTGIKARRRAFRRARDVLKSLGGQTS